MSVGTDIGIADALAAGVEHDTSGRRIIEQVAVMLLARDADSAGVDLGKCFSFGGRCPRSQCNRNGGSGEPAINRSREAPKK